MTTLGEKNSPFRTDVMKLVTNFDNLSTGQATGADQVVIIKNMQTLTILGILAPYQKTFQIVDYVMINIQKNSLVKILDFVPLSNL